METAGIRNDSRGDASLHQSTGAHHVDVGMLPNDVGNLLVHTLRLEVNVHEEEVRWMVEREDESRDHDCCRGPCRADVVDDAWIGDLISLAKLHADCSIASMWHRTRLLRCSLLQLRLENQMADEEPTFVRLGDASI